MAGREEHLASVHRVIESLIYARTLQLSHLSTHASPGGRPRGAMAGAGDQQLRRQVIQSFKLQGLTLQSQAAGLLAEVLEPLRDSEELEEVVDRIIEAVQRQPLSSSLVKREVYISHTHSLTISLSLLPRWC